jgi:hypothetical protein
MSGAAVPYRLRPHKAVDRRLFMSLLGRCERWRDLSRHVYISMGAYALEDHKLVHRLLGITRLLAFDKSEAIVARQRFNRPIATCKCVRLSSGDLTADVGLEVANAGIRGSKGYIVWLDYTKPSDLAHQIRQFEQLASQLAPGDIVRITVNAQFDAWAGPSRDSNGNQILSAARQLIALEKLKTTLDEYMPYGVKSSDLNPAGVARLIGAAFGLAAHKGVPAREGNVLEPLSLTSYADGQQMLSMTAMVIERKLRADFRRKLGLRDWHFSSGDWRDVKFLTVPDLTMRERLYLERHSNATAAKIRRDVGFDFDKVTEMPGFLDNFRRYYRHYPALTPVEF